jgi:gas vesicle protein
MSISGQSAMTGAAQGAKAGMAFGPYGAAIGGVIGAGAGLLSGRRAERGIEARQKAMEPVVYGQLYHNAAQQARVNSANEYMGNQLAGQAGQFRDMQSQYVQGYHPSEQDLYEAYQLAMARQGAAGGFQGLPQTSVSANPIPNDIAAYSDAIMRNRMGRSAAAAGGRAAQYARAQAGEMERQYGQDYEAQVMAQGQRLADLQDLYRMQMQALGQHVTTMTPIYEQAMANASNRGMGNINKAMMAQQMMGSLANAMPIGGFGGGK